MANEVVVQIAVMSVLAVIIVGLLFVFRMRKARIEPSSRVPEVPVQGRLYVDSSVDSRVNRLEKFERAEKSATPVFETVIATVQAETTNIIDAGISSNPGAEPEIIVQAKPLSNPEDRNQRILAGISENIRKNLIKPVPTYSPIQYSETPRETEYVRVKKKILTPHGQVRFSILKDSVSNNMLAIFRRVCMEWKSPKDLIAFLPPYLEYEAEVLDNQLLLIGTAGHNEKLAIPIRRVDPGSGYFGFFEFVTDDRTAVNTPAVLLAADDDEYEVVSRGVIVQPAFFGPAERNHKEVMLLVEKSFAIGAGGTALP